MEITKYERIIFQERDIEGYKQQLAKWHEYADKKHDISAENSYIFDDCESEIEHIKSYIPELSEDPINWPGSIYDIFYEYDFESKDDFVSGYESSLRKKAQDDFNRKIDWYSSQNAKAQCIKAQSDIESSQAKLFEMIKELQPSEQNELNRIRNSPKERINSSPSFVCSYLGDVIAEGFSTGLSNN